MKILFLFLMLLLQFMSSAQSKAFRFAFISDTHIGSPNGSAEEDLRRTVADINRMDDVAFVVITGDITEHGSDRQLEVAKRILDSLDIKYYIIPGNHDTGWSESGGLGYTSTFGGDKFHFIHEGVHFIGCASGPYVRMSDGHVPRDAMNWLEKKLKKIGKDEPIVFLNHYPLDNGLDNWYEVIDLLKTKNTIMALCGHGHNNRKVEAEGIPAIMGRSNLRARAAEGGYNLVDYRTDSIIFNERKPLTETTTRWRAIANQKMNYTSGNYPRPDFSMNAQYAGKVKPRWTWHSDANVISTPAVLGDLVVFGNQNGLVEAIDSKTGKRKWKFQTGGPIFSSPAAQDGLVVLGSADHYVYILDQKGKLRWKFNAGASVLGSPLIQDGKVYIGSSNGFYALELSTGHLLWKFSDMTGAVVSRPLIHNNTLIFGAWDTHLYALDKTNGSLLWKWNNGSRVINYSPAACIPVIQDDVVYIVAPDRYLSAIDIHSGETLWRSKEATVRESIGISEDGQWIYGKTMRDTVVAFPSSREAAAADWKMHAGFGYEHAPSMLTELDGQLFFGTKNGVVYVIDPKKQEITWTYKIDNSMVNTVRVLDKNNIIASTMDGRVVWLQTPVSQ